MSAEKDDKWSEIKTFVITLGTSGVVIGAIWGFYQALKTLFA
jgi:hypothetical protein